MEPITGAATVRRVALLGSHFPRQCGIATFTSDLSDALGVASLECLVVAMNDPGRSYDYPERVRCEVAQADVDSYRRAADFLNVNTIDVLSVQHEYGIFGGKAGALLLSLLRELRMPVVTTLHTVLARPDAAQRAVMDEVARLSERLVVMSHYGAALLRDVHGIAADRIDVIPHGIPVVPGARHSKHKLGVDGRRVLLTFGLLSPDKGIEHVIDALPEIVRSHPDTVYIVLGATHPHVRERHGESYRLMLEQRAHRLGVDAHTVFHNRFVSQEELTEFLAAADVYLTPYLKEEQITSGTLAYAVGCGKAVVSTPYWYARELLADDRGVLVPARDSAAIAAAVVALLSDDARRIAMGERAAAFGRDMTWPSVARRYGETFARAQQSHAARRGEAFQVRTLAHRPRELPGVDLRHLRLLTDSTGVLQHAAFDVPRYEDGYCLDDNARALLLTALIEDAGTEGRAGVRELSSRYLAFVFHALNPATGRFRNFMTYSRRWTEEVGSEDSHGRALWALGGVVGRSREPGRRGLGGELFHAALPAARALGSPRAWAYTLLGIDEYLRAVPGDERAEAAREDLGKRLLDVHRRASRGDWPWFEERLAYANARLSQALIVTGARTNDEAMTATGLRSLAWLDELQRGPKGELSPVGAKGFSSGERRPSFDQQPIEAGAMVSACLAARRVTGAARWTTSALSAFNWFLGHNHLEQPLVDATTGGCRDGLHEERVNDNQGAESTIAYLLALLEMRAGDSHADERLG